MNPFLWRNAPSKSGKDLGRIDVIRSKSTQNVEAARKQGVSLGTISGLIKKESILANRHGGAYGRAVPSKREVQCDGID